VCKIIHKWGVFAFVLRVKIIITNVASTHVCVCVCVCLHMYSCELTISVVKYEILLLLCTYLALYLIYILMSKVEWVKYTKKNKNERRS